MIRRLALMGIVAVAVVIVVATGVSLLGGVGTPARNSANVSAVSQDPPLQPDETFYAVAYHWGWSVFKEDGAKVDAIKLRKGTVVAIYAVNVFAREAIDKLPAPVAAAIKQVPVPPAEAILATQQDPPEERWPVLDHGFLIEWFGVAERLAANATEPTRVVIKADRPGNYEFVCTNYCGPGHTTMHPPMLFVEE